MSGTSGFARRLAGYLRENLFRFGLDVYLVFRTRLRVRESTPSHRETVIVDRDHRDHAALLVGFWQDHVQPTRSRSEIERTIDDRLEAGDQCFVVLEKGEIAGTTWVGYHDNWMYRRMAAGLGHADGEALLHGSFVRPASRGHGLQRQLTAAIFDYLQTEHRATTAVVYVGVNNLASVANRSRDFDEYRTIHHLELVLFGVRMNFFPVLERNPWRALNQQRTR